MNELGWTHTQRQTALCWTLEDTTNATSVLTLALLDMLYDMMIYNCMRYPVGTGTGTE